MLVLEALDGMASEQVQSFQSASKRFFELGQLQEHHTQQYLVDPLKRFCKIFPATAKSFADQKAAGQTLRKAKEKVSKLKGKVGGDAEKLLKAERASADATAADHQAHELATKDVSAVVELRTAYVQPCLLALLQSEVLYLEQVQAVIETVTSAPNNDDATSLPMQHEDVYRAQTKALLDEFNQLSIVGSAK
jgi:hypothetical protein